MLNLTTLSDHDALLSTATVASDCPARCLPLLHPAITNLPKSLAPNKAKALILKLAGVIEARNTWRRNSTGSPHEIKRQLNGTIMFLSGHRKSCA